MDQTQLKQKIVEYYIKLSDNMQKFFSDMNWVANLEEINKKYNLDQKQIEMLSTETTLVLLCIIPMDEYVEIIEKELGITDKEKFDQFLSEINEKIFKDIGYELEDIYVKNIASLSKEKNNIFDSRFFGLPKQVQEAIASSNWRETLYSLAPKYKLTVEQMGVLEEITVKVMLNTIHSSAYESEFASKITISKEDVSNLIKEVDENIFKKIRSFEENDKIGEERIINNEESASRQDGLRINNVNSEKVNINQEEEIPLPPYKTNSKEQVISSMPKIESNIMNDSSKNYVVSNREEEKPEINAGQNDIQNVLKKIEPIKIPIKPVEPVSQTMPQNPQAEKTPSFPQQTTPAPRNIIEKKLINPTVSENFITDYSSPKTHDPYREPL